MKALAFHCGAKNEIVTDVLIRHSLPVTLIPHINVFIAAGISDTIRY